MATAASRERFHAARERSLFDPPMSERERATAAPPSFLRCPCGPHPSVAAFIAHRDSGACPHNAPMGRAFPHWALRVRALTPAELERKALARERLDAVKANPVYIANAKAKKERAKALQLNLNRKGSR